MVRTPPRRGGQVDRRPSRTGSNFDRTYFFTFFFAAQYAFNFFDRAFRSAADILLRRPGRLERSGSAPAEPRMPAARRRTSSSV